MTTARIGGVKRVRVKQGMVPRFEQLFAELQAKVRENEPGTIYYDLFRSRSSPLDYVVTEKYDSKQAWEAHQGSPHGKVLFPQMRAILDELVVEYFDEQSST